MNTPDTREEEIDPFVVQKAASLIDQLHDRVIDLKQQQSELRMAIQKVHEELLELEQLRKYARLALEGANLNII